MFDTRILRSVGLLLAVLALVLAFGLRTAPSSAGSAPAEVYAVQAGDTLWSIASAQTDADPRELVAQIRQLNELSSTVLQLGQTLLLPTR
ncbi:MAG: LysM peptidoglycan-binding domain-containing protein [Thermoleophilia bacterium]|nr:LysM peptidoglycan-binding domain-containing protein [Thermoleophilia bacterium]